MADVLGYLDEVVHRVSLTFMPAEMEDVAAFLRGEASVVLTTTSTAAAAASPPSSTPPRTKAAESDETTSTERGDGHHEGSRPPCSSSPPPPPQGTPMPMTLRYPLGATQWGGFIPLGIAGSTLLSAATSGSRAVLLSFFELNGFAQVFTVNFIPSDAQTSVEMSSGSHGSGGYMTHSHTDAATAGTPASGLERFMKESASRAGNALLSRKRSRLNNSPSNLGVGGAGASSSTIAEVAFDGRCGTTAQSARHACIAAVRRWLEAAEAAAHAEHATGASSSAAASSLLSDPLSGRSVEKTQRQRLLIVVRCCADNRAAAVVAARVGGAAGGTTATASAAAGSRRNRSGDDPLVLFLHDLAALTTLFEVRLSATHVVVRPAVLLLPEDDSYGGAMLRRQLQEEVGYRYWVQLFLQSDAHTAGSGGGGGGNTTSVGGRVGGAAAGEAWTATVAGSGDALLRLRHAHAESPLLRGCRLAAQWGVLDIAGLSAPLTETEATRDVSKGTSFQLSSSPPVDLTASVLAHAAPQKLEEALRRHGSTFFARPANAPLCVFLMESLRRFPVLVPPAVLQHWQSTWTARHSLTDVLLAVHTALCPFTLSATYAQDYSGSSSGNAPLVTSTMLEREGEGDVDISSSEKPVCASPSSAQLLQDTTDLLDALLDASFTLAEERDGVQALSERDFRIEQATLFSLMYEALAHQRAGRLRRVPGVVEVLVRLYDRHASSTHTLSFAPLPSRDATREEKATYATRHLLPFPPLNRFYESVLQLTKASSSTGAASTSRGAVREVQSYPMNSLILPLPRRSVAPQLQNSTLLAVLPPEDSLLELQGVAERIWTEELPASWQHLVTLAHGGHHSADGTAAAEKSEATHTPTQLSAENFFHPLVPHAVRVLYLLTSHAAHAPTEAAKQVPVVQLQLVCQLTDEQLLLVLRELQMAGLISVNPKTQTARALLDTV